MIPWNDGPGNIVLTFTGQGNERVSVTSDTDCIDHSRQQSVTFVVDHGATRLFVRAQNGYEIRTSDSQNVNALGNDMKVVVVVHQLATSKKILVTAQSQIVRVNNGNIVRVND